MSRFATFIVTLYALLALFMFFPLLISLALTFTQGENPAWMLLAGCAYVTVPLGSVVAVLLTLVLLARKGYRYIKRERSE